MPDTQDERVTEEVVDALHAAHIASVEIIPDPQIATLKDQLDMAVAALESAHEQLSLLAKDPATNPWVKECGEALAAIKGEG